MMNVEALLYKGINENTGRKDGSTALASVEASWNLVKPIYVAAKKGLHNPAEKPSDCS